MLLRIDCAVYIETADDADPEMIALEFDGGFSEAVANFGSAFDDGREVVSAKVRQISLVSEDEAEIEGLTE